MHKRRLVTTRVVGMAMLLMATTSWSMIAADGSSPKADTANPPATGKAANSAEKSSDQITALKQQMALQQQQIEQMQKMMEQQKALLEKLSRESAEQAQQAAQQTTAPNLGQVASAVPMLPASPKPAASPVPNPAAAPVSQEQVKGYTEKVDNLQKAVDSLNKGLGGFKVSGSVRIRSDNTIPVVELRGRPTAEYPQPVSRVDRRR
jgi:small-conductance mechanosensitive channel